MSEIKLDYLNLHKIISYGCPVNIIITERGKGKSFALKDYCINKFIKKDYQFLYLRRYDNELKSIFQETKGVKRDFFNDIRNKYENFELEAKNRQFLINKETFGIAKRMTEAQDLKSTENSNIKTIFIDEYGIEKNSHRFYLPNEGMVLMGIFDSIARNRSDIKIFILSNAVEDIEYSPLFTFFNLSLPFNSEYKTFKDNTILVYYSRDKKFQEQRKQTLIGKLASGTKYEDYAINNKIINKNNDFLARKTGSAKFSFALMFKNNIYGIWNSFNEGRIYVSKDYDKFTPYFFSMTLQDFKPNTMMFSAMKKYNFWKLFLENFKLGNVYFENQKIKHEMYELIKMYYNK